MLIKKSDHDDDYYYYYTCRSKFWALMSVVFELSRDTERTATSTTDIMDDDDVCHCRCLKACV